MPPYSQDTYCGAARTAGRTVRDEATAVRRSGLSDREKDAMVRECVQNWLKESCAWRVDTKNVNGSERDYWSCPASAVCSLG